MCDLLRLDKQPVLLHGTPSTIVKPKRSSYTFAFSQMLSNGSVGTDTEDQLEFTKAIDLPKSKELSKSNSGTGGQQDGIYIGENEPLIPFFDHKGCADCSCVITMTQDCTSAFEEIHNIQVEATKQLSLLVEVRERMHEVMENVATYNQQLSGGATSEEGVAAES